MRNPMPSRALRVLFDESLAVNPAGTGTFARGLRRALDGIDGVEVVGSRIGGESMRSIEVARKPLRRRLGSAAAHLRYYGLVLPARARKIHADVVFSPSTLGPLRGPTPWVVTVHDLAPLEQAATMHWLSRIYLRRTLELQLRRATAVCTVSAAVRAELGERFPELDGDRVTRAAIGMFGMGSTPLRAAEAEAALAGSSVGEVDLEEVGRTAADATDPPNDIHASASYRRKVGGGGHYVGGQRCQHLVGSLGPDEHVDVQVDRAPRLLRAPRHAVGHEARVRPRVEVVRRRMQVEAAQRDSRKGAAQLDGLRYEGFLDTELGRGSGHLQPTR